MISKLCDHSILGFYLLKNGESHRKGSATYYQFVLYWSRGVWWGNVQWLLGFCFHCMSTEHVRAYGQCSFFYPVLRCVQSQISLSNNNFLDLSQDVHWDLQKDANHEKLWCHWFRYVVLHCSLTVFKLLTKHEPTPPKKNAASAGSTLECLFVIIASCMLVSHAEYCWI